MEILLIALFVMGYLAITLEHTLKVDKLIPGSKPMQEPLHHKIVDNLPSIRHSLLSIPLPVPAHVPNVLGFPVRDMTIIAPNPIVKGTYVKWPGNVPPEIVSTVHEEIVDTYELVVVLLLDVSQPADQEDPFSTILAH